MSRAGQWVQQEAWTSANVNEARSTDPHRRWANALNSAELGSAAARSLREAAVNSGGPRPARYLALVAQDLDDMGKRLSGENTEHDRSSAPEVVNPHWHRKLSSQLLSVAETQREALEGVDLLGKVIYAGGDDLLALVPASTAVAAARAARGALVQGPDLPTASTAVYFFHQHSNLSDAVQRVHALLAEAKVVSPAKHAVAVGFQRRSGNDYSLVRPWDAGTGSASLVDLLEALRVPDPLSFTPGLLGQLRRDRAELESLVIDRRAFRAELRRLVKRHVVASMGPDLPAFTGAVDEWTTALADLASQFGANHVDILGAVRIGLFLRQECR